MNFNVVTDVIVPFVVGVVIPFLTNWTTAKGWPEYIETILNAGLSAAASAIVTIPFDGDWKTFVISFGIAWLTTWRSLGTKLPQAIYSDRVTSNKHEKQDQV